jgi:gluconolactonase
MLTRRQFVEAVAAAGAAAVTPAAPMAQAPARSPAQTAGQAPQGPPSTVTTPPRDFGPTAPPTTYFTDPDIISVDPSFGAYVQANSAIARLWTGGLWCEGPAWSGQGRYLVWSDIPNNRQLRWLEDDNRVTVFRSPSNNSNGNTFDVQGRQLSCEHLSRRVVRYEHDGSVTVIADAYNGKRLNSPNDVVQHRDGSYWFTDPPYGRSLYEGQPEPRELPNGVYRADGKGAVTLVATEQQVPDPNGLTFAPDYTKLYVVSTGKGPGDTGPGGKGDMFVFDVAADNSLSNPKRFADFVIDGVKCSPDGVRCDVAGNLWCSSNAGRAVGYSGVTVWTPEGKLIGRIRLPEVCGNLCFGGPKRNRLFMAASQSLYAVYVNTQGAGPA